MNFTERVAENQRLLILQMLEQDAGYSHNETVLQMGLEAMGHSVSLDKVRANMDWLADVSLVTVSESAIGKVAKITARGLDVAKGRAVVTGVSRPLPGA
jgi:Fe2+ or Zn2+ uptake regulation protein